LTAIRAVRAATKKKEAKMQDIYTQFNEALAEVDKAGKRKQFDERAKTLTSVESKLNCAKFVLGVKESTPRIPKNNGRSSEELTESAGNRAKAEQIKEQSDTLMYRALGISEADQRRLRNLPPVGTNLNTKQLREFRFLRGCRIDEADAVRLALKVA
jgi:hypothetical protein